MKNYFSKLKGGDLRSIARANEVVNDVKNQEDFDVLFKELYHTDRKIRMRTADAIEKITVSNPEYLTSHKKELIHLCTQVQHIELKWHLALIISRFPLKPTELKKVWRLLSGWAKDKEASKIVRVNSLQSLYTLCEQNNNLKSELKWMIDEISKENIPSLNARIKKNQSSLLPSSAIRTIFG